MQPRAPGVAGQDGGVTVPARTVLYCSFGPASNSGYFTALSRLVRSIGERLGTAAELASLEGSRFSTKQLRVFHPFDTHLLLRNIYLRAQRGDVGAVVIGNIQDPGLYEARLACPAPVVGLLESAVTAVRPFGASVGLLASSALTVPLLRERLRQYQATGIVAAIEVCGPELGTWGQAFTSEAVRSAALDSVLEAAGRAAAAGAELVVPASGIVAVLLATACSGDAAWTPRPGLPPLLNPVYIAMAHAVMTMNLQAAGLPVSRAGSYAAPSAEELRAFFTGPYGGERGGSRLDE
jgi:hypothetical protein